MTRTAVITATELPGPARHGVNPRGVWIDRLEKAKVASKPGLWFRIMACEDADKAANHARNINHGRVVLPPGRWRAAARTEDGTSYVWVQYVGE